MEKVDMSAVQDVLEKGCVREFGPVLGLVRRLTDSGLTVKLGEGFGAPEVDLTLNTDFYAKEVNGYYINYSSMWSTAERADTLSFILGRMANIARDLEAIGVMSTA